MADIPDKTAAQRRTAPEQPYPSWPELLAKVAVSKPERRTSEDQTARAWSNVVADLINDRR